MQASNRKKVNRFKFSECQRSIWEEFNRTQFQSLLLKFRVSQVFVGNSFEKNYSFKTSFRSVRFLIQTLMDGIKPVDTEIEKKFWVWRRNKNKKLSFWKVGFSSVWWKLQGIEWSIDSSSSIVNLPVEKEISGKYFKKHLSEIFGLFFADGLRFKRKNSTTPSSLECFCRVGRWRKKNRL